MMDNSSVIIITNNKNTGKASNIRIGDSSPSKYPVFYFFSKIASFKNEPEWKEFFEIMSKGKFFKEFKFDNNFLIYKQKNKKKNISIELICEGNINSSTFLDSNLMLYERCKEFIKINSTYFIKNSSQTVEPEQNIEKKEKNLSLGMSVPKQIYKIKEYVSRSAKKFYLTERDQESLVSLIFENTLSKRLTSKSFHMLDENHIDYIDHLVFVPGGFSFVGLPPEKIKKTKVLPEEPEKIAFKCSKYLFANK